MAMKPAKKKGSGKKADPDKKKDAAKKPGKKKESPERATFREQLEGSARYHLEKWNQKMGMSLKKVKQAEDSELIDELLTKFDEGEIALNDLAPKGGKGGKSKAKSKATDPDDDSIDDILDDELGDDDDEGEDDGSDDSDDSGEDDDIDALLDDELGGEDDSEDESGEDDDEDGGEEEEEDLGKSAIEDKLDQIINQNTKIANKIDKVTEFLSTSLDVLVAIDAAVKEGYAFLRVYAKAALKINKVKDTVYDKILKKAKAVAKKGDKEDE